MSIKKFPGAVISDVPVEPAGNYQDSAASGVWTLEQQAYWEAQGLWPVPGNPNPDSYIENLFSTYLYTGNSSTQTITNGIDLDGEGGLVWGKCRSTSRIHNLYDTERGVTNRLRSDMTNAQDIGIQGVTAFNSNGFTLGSDAQTNYLNNTFASWTFRKKPKFFDIVTYTGTGSATTIPHNLGSVPGMIIVKRTDSTANWAVYHRGLTSANYSLLLNLTGAQDTTGYFANTTPTDTVFSVSSNSVVNASGGTYVAYLFAHDAGGFGDDGTENVISCGSYTGAYPSTVELDLGFEPQWLLIKNASRSSNWGIWDVARGLPVGGDTKNLVADSSAAENGVLGNGVLGDLTPTGFIIDSGLTATNVSGDTHIYMAIRRGPMATPTSGTEVLGLVARAGTGVATTVESGVLNDLAIIKNRGSNGEPSLWANRLTGPYYMKSSQTSAETSSTTAVIPANPWDLMGGMRVGSTSAATNASGSNFINYQLRRAPGFFEQVCYTGTGVAGRTVAHNLGVVPELMIVKNRTTSGYGWAVYTATVGNTAFLQLNATSTPNTNIVWWNNTSPTSSLFTVGSNQFVNESADNYVAHLFASLPGVSKVGSYVGNGTTQTIDCGFTSGARFVMTRRVSNSGSWLVFDSARGIVDGNDPYFQLNNGDAEVTNTDRLDSAASGFTVNFIAGSDVDTNVNGDTYIFLAIA